MAAILRLADALDRTHYQIVDGVACTISAQEVEFNVRTDQDAELELWTARQAADIFEREFGMPLSLRIAETPPEEKE